MTVALAPSSTAQTWAMSKRSVLALWRQPSLVVPSIIFPLFPEMLEWYVAKEGAASSIGKLASWLEGLVQDDFAVIVLFGGILGSLYSGLQFVFAPVWGAVSDKIVFLIPHGGIGMGLIATGQMGAFRTLILRALYMVEIGLTAIFGAFDDAVGDAGEGVVQLGHVGLLLGRGHSIGRYR